MSETISLIENDELNIPFEQLLQQFSQGVLITDDLGKILKINPAFEKLSNFFKDELLGDCIENYRFCPMSFSQIKRKGHWKGEVIIEQKNGVPRNLWLEALTYKSFRGKINLVFLYRDVHPLAFLDPLTDLPNRRCFKKCLDKTLKANKLQDAFTLLYVDLDRFKKINDTLGHACGDELLVAASKRLRSCLREKDVLSRLGGDEFICFLPNIKGKQEAESVAQRILDALSYPFSLLDQEIYISASIGLCRYPLDGDSLETLMTNADMAMYRAKKLGKNQYEWFQADQQAGAFETFMLENHLRNALQKQEFFLQYQPLMSLETGSVIAVEALLRWEHPELGLISPNQFIPIAEETGLIISIGNWVIREACSQGMKWQSQGFEPVKISVNLSPKQFLQRNLAENVQAVLAETGLEPPYLNLEITENIIIQDFEMAVSNLHQLKEMGIYISIDDFGTGYSSFNYLSKLPIDNVKIDRSFIRDIEENPKNEVLTNAIISLAHALDLEVVAEGIETVGQREHVKKMQCDVIQGFLISKPLLPNQVCHYFTQNERSNSNA